MKTEESNREASGVSLLGGQSCMAFVASARHAESRSFYERVLGLTVESEDGFAIVCRLRGALLRIQKVASFHPQPFTVLGWQVADLNATVDSLRKRGVSFERFDGMEQDDRGIWSSPSGARVAWFKDPDGNVLSLTAP